MTTRGREAGTRPRRSDSDPSSFPDQQPQKASQRSRLLRPAMAGGVGL